MYRTPKTAAMSAIFLHSVKPPAAAVSGWMISMASERRMSRKPYLFFYHQSNVMAMCDVTPSYSTSA